MKLPDKVYDVLKWVALFFLPGLATFYGIVGKTCDIPHTDAVVIIISALATFIGTCIGISQYTINKEKKNEQAEAEQTTEDK